MASSSSLVVMMTPTPFAVALLLLVTWLDCISKNHVTINISTVSKGCNIIAITSVAIRIINTTPTYKSHQHLLYPIHQSIHPSSCSPSLSALCLRVTGHSLWVSSKERKSWTSFLRCFSSFCWINHHSVCNYPNPIRKVYNHWWILFPTK